MEKIKAGFAMCASFCTFARVLPVIYEMAQSNFEVFPIMSPAAYNTDTRFGSARDFINKIEQATGKKIINTIFEAEPIGPKKMLDVLIIAPCTGNTLGKLTGGIFDTSVTLAAKAHLRNERPLVIAVSTNDALSSSAQSIGSLMNRKNIYFVPMRQDDPIKKPSSMVADFTQIIPTAESALNGKQIQPVYV